MELTVVVVLVVLAVIAAAAFLAMQGRRRRQEQLRIEVAEHRHEAEIRSASAQRRAAEASERAARAEHERAQAGEQAARARQDREVAEARQAAADRIDPDVRTPDPSRDTADPAARTDDLRPGGRTPPAAQEERAGPHEHRESTPRWQSGGGWHGPTASGGFPAVDPATRDTAPSGGATAPGGPRHAESRPTSGPDAEASVPTGLGEPAAPGPAVPSQRTGEHDRDQPEPTDDEHSGPVRALTDRLLRRHG